MAKRIVTKIGDIFSVTLDNGNLRFFQYIANDSSCLGGSVIRVFKKKYPKGYELNPEEVVSDDVDFYALTLLKIGVSDGDWLYGMLNSYMATSLMDRKHIKYPELDIINKKIQNLYNKSAKEALSKMNDVHPNVSLIDGYSGALLAYSLFQENMKINDN